VTICNNSEVISIFALLNLTVNLVKDAVAYCRLISFVYDLIYKLIWDVDRRRHSLKLLC